MMEPSWEVLVVDVKTVLLHALRSERRLTRETVAAMAAGEMGFRPTPEQMDFGTQALHILSCYATLLGALDGKGWVWEQGMTREAYPTQEAILTLYDTETDRLLRYLEGMNPGALGAAIETSWGTRETAAELLIAWIAHEGHHRGQMVTYLRLRGMQPPKY